MIQDQQRDHVEPTATLSYELAPAVYTLLAGQPEVEQVLLTTLSQQVAGIMQTLGIPGVPEVRIVSIDPVQARESYWLRLVVNDRLCRFPHELLVKVHSFVSDSMLMPVVQSGPIMTWLTGLSLEVAEQRELFVSFLACACLEIIKKQPHVLLGLSQAAAYARDLPLPDRVGGDSSPWPPDPSRLHPILSAVLQLKISLADRQRVALVIFTLRTQTPQAIAEALIEALRTDCIEMHFAPASLQQLTTSINPSSNEAGVFSALRSELYRESGLRFPDFHFVKDDTMRPGTFALKVHELLLLPWKILAPGQMLVNTMATTMQQTYQREGVAILHPFYWWENCVVQSENFPQIQDATWNQWDYIKFCTKADLKEQAASYIYTQQVQARLDLLAPTQGALIQAVRSKQSLEEVTSLLRTLARQGINIRTLGPILERWLDAIFLATNLPKAALIDYALIYNSRTLDLMRASNAHYRTSFIRSGLSGSIGTTFFDNTITNTVYTLDPSVELLIVQKQQQHEQVVFSDNESDLILDSIHAQVATLSTVELIPPCLSR